MITFEKLDESCSNIYLIDENLCIGKSLDIINYNYKVLYDSIQELSQYINEWDALYTITTTYSSYWYIAANNVNVNGYDWLDTCNLVQSMSADWNKKFTLVFPTMQDISTWYSLNTNDQDTIIKSWLDFNFSPQSYLNQEIEVVVYLNESKPFNFNFTRSYRETCVPNGGGGVVSCNECRRPHRGCNHHGGLAGYGPCTNAYSHCGVTTTSTQASYSCVGTGGRTLTVSINKEAQEINVARVIRITYKNINREWNRIL